MFAVARYDRPAFFRSTGPPCLASPWLPMRPPAKRHVRMRSSVRNESRVGILEDTQDPRAPEKPGKIKIRGTGFHLHDGYIVTARHAVEKTQPVRSSGSQGHSCSDD